MFVEFDGHVLHAETHGDPVKPALVLLHSLGTCGRVWEKQVEALREHHFIVCPDLRGHGLSEVSKTHVSIELLAADVDAIVKTLDFGAYHLCGISIGGLVAQALAANEPEKIKTLTLLDSNLVSLNPPMWRDRARKCREDGLRSIADGVLSRWTTPDFRKTTAGRALATMLARTPDEGYAAGCDALADADCRNYAAKLHMPVSVALGEFDEATPRTAAEALAAALGGAAVHVIPGAAHIPLFQAPKEVNGLLAATFARA
ncbi:alpha/beta fold hydrolase [Rhizobium sp. AU243]|uniref:alpha/beta fold hydrolase n=1 Tax=Rhizobium sp. AU243 TaxID=2303425 RepID=UPI0010CCA495|nr:alpha/beta fold hydrolase [Rhizobium sp. AU243]TKV70758.1 alpha/beta fold hydrolase [Rhizobium sp. AU243]